MTKQRRCPYCNIVKEKNKRLCFNILCPKSKSHSIKIKENRKIKKRLEIHMKKKINALEKKKKLENAQKKREEKRKIKEKEKEEKQAIKLEKKTTKIVKNTLSDIIKEIINEEKERKKIEKEKQKQKQTEIKRKKQQEDQAKRGEKALISRWSDQYYYYTRAIYYEHYSHLNPEFTKEDRIKKCEILNIANCKTCFITGEKSKGVGDHLFEINGYAKFTNGKHGTYDEWNTVPVVGKLNKSYKKFKFKNGTTKDIGYQELTQEEFNECSDKNKVIYIKIINWKNYVISRKASFYWEMTEKQSRWLEQKEKEYKRIVMKDIQEIKMLN